jgi:hypothetical protein
VNLLKMKYVWKATNEEKNTFEGHKRKSGETSAIGSSGGPSHLGFGEETDHNDEEAITVASLIAAAIAIPEYAGATFGIIAMVGNSQAALIDKLLRHKLTAAVYEERKIMCGNHGARNIQNMIVVFGRLIAARSFMWTRSRSA